MVDADCSLAKPDAHINEDEMRPKRASPDGETTWRDLDFEDVLRTVSGSWAGEAPRCA
jgi:hypothetical protein